MMMTVTDFMWLQSELSKMLDELQFHFVKTGYFTDHSQQTFLLVIGGEAQE